MKSQQVIFKDVNDYLSRRNKMSDNIKGSIIEWVIKDKFEYEQMIYQGLTSKQMVNIDETLRDELAKFTEHKCDDLCYKISLNIILGIMGIFDGLNIIKRSTDFSAEEYAELIHNSIMYQLDKYYLGILRADLNCE